MSEELIVCREGGREGRMSYIVRVKGDAMTVPGEQVRGEEDRMWKGKREGEGGKEGEGKSGSQDDRCHWGVYSSNNFKDEETADCI